MKKQRRQCLLEGCNNTFTPKNWNKLFCCPYHAQSNARNLHKKTTSSEVYKPHTYRNAITYMSGVHYEDIAAYEK